MSAEENFEEALAEAEIKDAEREQAIRDGNADMLPLLHGIPISAKEMVS